MASRYRLRSGLRLQRDASGRMLLHDAAFRRSLRLGEADARVVTAIAAPAGATMAALLAFDPGAGQRLSGLARLYLLAGSRSALRLRSLHEAPGHTSDDHAADPAAGGAAVDAATITLHWPRGVDPPRHACVAVGACCSASFLGPMTARDRVRVEGLAMGTRARVARGSEAIEELAFRGAIHVGMARQHGRCVAQGDDGLCDIHATWGMATKPVPCKQFPLRFHRSPRGVHVSLLLACEGYDRGRDLAAPWPTREAEVRGLLAEGAVAVPWAWPPEWTPGVPVPGESLWQVLATLEAARDRDGGDGGVTWLREALAWADSQTEAAERSLAEGPDVRVRARLDGMIAALDWWRGAAGAHGWPPAAAAALVAELQTRSAGLAAADEPADAARLARLAEVVATMVSAERDGPTATTLRDAVSLDAAAATILRDVVANDLPTAVPVAALDSGLATLAARLVFAHLDARLRAFRRGERVATGHDATLALKLVARSEADLQQLAAMRVGTPHGA